MSNQKHNSLLKQFQKGYRQPVQDQPGTPGLQEKLDPQPLDDVTADGKPYKAANKLEGKAALITGADSGIGRAIAILYALEGADLTLTYLPQEEKEIKAVEQRIHAKTCGKTKVVTIAADVRKESVCQDVIKQHMSAHGRLDVLALNHGTQEANTELPTLPTEQWHNTFDTNLHSFFYFCKAALPNMGPGSSVIFNASINFAVGHPELIDYTATKGAMIALARALSNQVAGDGIRVNAVAPGPIWTPLIPATMTKKSKESFGQSVPMGRAGQPIEVATSFVFLASADSSYISGQVFHVNGGVVIN